MTEHFQVHGGARLVGEVGVVGAKNSVLKLMAAALLAEGTTTITNCPEILDVPLMGDVLRSLGCEVEIDGRTATRTDCGCSARAATSSTARWSPRRTTCGARRSGWTSPASAPPRTSSWLRSW